MVDIKKMREQQERELNIALMTNKLITEHPEIAERGLKLSLFDSEWNGEHTTRGTVYENYPHKICEQDAGMLLSLFPADEKFPVYQGDNKYSDEYYLMDLHRNPAQSDTHLHIEWKSNGIKFYIRFPILPNSELMSWFRIRERKLDECEISSYGIQKNRYTYNMRNNFQQLDWASGRSIHFVGATWQQTEHAVMNSIAECLKYNYQFKEE